MKEICDTLYIEIDHHYKVMAWVYHMQEDIHLLEVKKRHQH